MTALQALAGFGAVALLTFGALAVVVWRAVLTGATIPEVQK